MVKPRDYCERAVELGHKEYFTTEHGYQGNIFDAYNACQEYGLKCVYSVEAYYVDDRLEKDNSNHHICLIAMNEQGQFQINEILSQANIDGYYYKPRIDLSLLLKLDPANVIITTACIASRLFKDNWFEAFFMPIYNHFKDRLYLEVQCHNADVQKEHNQKILQLSKEYNLKIIHGNDSHYIFPEDKKYRALFIEAKGIHYGDEDSFILDYPDYDTIVERYREQGVLSDEEIYAALDNTLVFDDAEGIKLNKEFKIPKVIKGDSNELLKDIINKAWKRERENIPKSRWKQYLTEIKYEYGMIEKCGMADYFILDHFIVNKAVNDYGATLTRTGRGSAVSYYINKLLGLTELDRIWCPIKLYPTRFMTDTRILQSRSLPDIDLNFADVAPVIKASQDYLGEDGIRQMVSFKPLQKSSAFRLWCKANGYDVKEYDEIAKDLRNYKKEYDGIYKDDPKWGKIIRESQVFNGVIESISPSPCSYLLYDKEISKEIGLMSIGSESSNERVICCVLDGKNCDKFKYLKNDYLIVTCWDIISRVYKMLGKPIDDIKSLLSKCGDNVWKLYADGMTSTLNQADTPYDKQILSKYKPTSFEEMSAYVAAIRPGFASQLNSFVNREEYSTGVKELDDILQDSFHYLMYQENIMTYLTWLGIPEKDTYDIIKKISKKIFTDEELNELKEKLRTGWLKKVGTIDGFSKTWEIVELSASYSFNASHSASVALDSIYGAYLKANYPFEYYTVVLDIYSGDIAKTSALSQELSYFDIELKPARFRYSSSKYTPDKAHNIIYKGISSIKYCNDALGEELYKLRFEKYNSFLDFLKDNPCNLKQTEILIKLDFFEEFGRSQKLLDIYKLYREYGKRKVIAKNADLDQYVLRKYCTETEKQFRVKDLDGLLNELVAPIPDKSISLAELLACEQEYLGYISYTNPSLKGYVYVVGVDTKYSPKITVYAISNGNTLSLKISKPIFNKCVVGQNDVIRIVQLTKKNKCIKVNDEFKKVPDEYDYWVTKYQKVTTR